MIKASFTENSAFILWDNQLSEIIAIIASPNPNLTHNIDVTDKVKEAIGDHFVCDKVTLPRRKIVLETNVDQIDFSVNTIEDNQEGVRDIRVTSTSTY